MNRVMISIMQKMRSQSSVTGSSVNLLPGVGVGVAWKTMKQPDEKAGLLSELLKIKSVVNEYLLLIDLEYAENFFDWDEDKRFDSSIPSLIHSAELRYYLGLENIYKFIFDAYRAVEKEVYDSKCYLTYVMSGQDTTNHLAATVEFYEHVKLLSYIMSTDEQGEAYYANLQEYGWEEEKLVDLEQMEVLYRVLVDTLEIIDKEIAEVCV
ncbi:MAG: hypothetical protein LPK00_05775 [Bacillaceae bacterium]|nr:hypothetical protein [Bacillaceae bacterium]